VFFAFPESFSQKKHGPEKPRGCDYGKRDEKRLAPAGGRDQPDLIQTSILAHNQTKKRALVCVGFLVFFRPIKKRGVRGDLFFLAAGRFGMGLKGPPPSPPMGGNCKTPAPPQIVCPSPRGGIWGWGCFEFFGVMFFGPFPFVVPWHVAKRGICVDKRQWGTGATGRTLGPLWETKGGGPQSGTERKREETGHLRIYRGPAPLGPPRRLRPPRGKKENWADAGPALRKKPKKIRRST